MERAFGVVDVFGLLYILCGGDWRVCVELCRYVSMVSGFGMERNSPSKPVGFGFLLLAMVPCLVLSTGEALVGLVSRRLRCQTLKKSRFEEDGEETR